MAIMVKVKIDTADILGQEGVPPIIYKQIFYGRNEKGHLQVRVETGVGRNNKVIDVSYRKLGKLYEHNFAFPESSLRIACDTASDKIAPLISNFLEGGTHEADLKRERIIELPDAPEIIIASVDIAADLKVLTAAR